MVNGETAANGRLGIVFTGGEGPEPCAINVNLTAKPLIVAADSGLFLAEEAGLPPDWIVGDMDSVDAERLAGHVPEKILRFHSDKDYTDTELAISLLREKGCGPVWIIGGGGGRIDHLFGIRALFEREYPPERWITAAEDIRCLQAPQQSAARHSAGQKPCGALPSVLEFASGSRAPLAPVSVFPLGDGPWEAESAGLKWPLAGLGWNRGFFGLSNEAPEGVFTIRVKQGRFMVILENRV
ncbi:MAG: thiamine diphosphokinase [Spirochaetaceae bacterium]|jgi:thiamine pyrophosphokinase|nr:thiamine diphosphokinase [Spirochaetaceae bacterium]